MSLKLIAQILVVSSLTFSSVTQASNDPLVGKWKTIDDRTGYSLSDVVIQKNKTGSYSATIVEIRAAPGAVMQTACVKCNGEHKNKPLVGFTPLYNLKNSANSSSEFINGKYVDPRTGNEYQSKAHLSNNGKHLIIRNTTPGATTGRNLTWVKY